MGDSGTVPGHKVCCIADSGDGTLPRSEEWLAPPRAHPQTRTGLDARSVRLLLVHHLRADTGAQHEHQNGPEDHEQHHAEGGQHLRQRVLERLAPELSRRRQRQLGFATGRGQARRRGCRWGRRLSGRRAERSSGGAPPPSAARTGSAAPPPASPSQPSSAALAPPLTLSLSIHHRINLNAHRMRGVVRGSCSSSRCVVLPKEP